MEHPQLALFLFAAAVGLLIVVAGPIIFILRRTSGYKKARERERLEQANAERTMTDYAQAGLQVRKFSPLEAFFASSGTAGTTGEHAGVKFTYEILGKAYKDSIPRTLLSVPGTLRGQFTVTRGGSPGGLLTRIGFAGELQTGDAAFDAAFMVRGAPRAYMQALFSDSTNREAMRALFELGFDRVQLDAGSVSARRSGETRLLDPGVLTLAVERIASLRAAPGMAGAGTRISSKSLAWVGLIVALGSLVAMLLGGWIRPLTENWQSIASREWRMVALASAAYLAAAIFLLRGRPSAYFELFNSLLVLLLLLAGGHGAAFWANQRYDASTLSTHQVRLVRKYETGSTRRRAYYFEFESWRPDLKFVAINVPPGFYQSFPPGREVKVGTHAGWLGIEWIDTVDGAPIKD